MEDKPSQFLSPFDCSVIPASLQMMKLLLPYLPVGQQPMFGMLIRFMELQSTMQFFRNHKHGFHTDSSGNNSGFPNGILKDLAPYFGTDYSESINNMMGMMDMFEMYSQMSSQEYPEEPCQQKGDPDYGGLDEPPGNQGTGPAETGTDQESASTDPWESGEESGSGYDDFDYRCQPARDSFHEQ